MIITAVKNIFDEDNVKLMNLLMTRGMSNGRHGNLFLRTVTVYKLI